jgi:hypothetical protein
MAGTKIITAFVVGLIVGKLTAFSDQKIILATLQTIPTHTHTQ